MGNLQGPEKTLGGLARGLDWIGLNGNWSLGSKSKQLPNFCSHQSKQGAIDKKSSRDIVRSMNCYRHQDRAAKRKCYKCKQPVCPECQFKLDGHIFCSEVCHQQWQEKREEHKRKSAQQKSRPRPDVRLAVLEDKMEQSASNWSKAEALLRRVERDQRRIKTGSLAAVIVAAILLLVVAIAITAGLVNGWFSPRPGNIGEQAQASAAFDPGYPGTLAGEIFLEAPNLELPPGEIAVEQGRFNLYGRAPGAKRVTLLVNGRESAGLGVKSGQFVFRDVPLSSGPNIVQVMSKDDKGNLAYSIAELLEYSGLEKARVQYTPGLNYQRGSRRTQAIALTFDAGGEAGYASKVMEILRERGINLTIFVTGQFIEQNPEVVRQLVEDGHEVGNHTYDHPHLTTFEENRRHWTRPEVTKEYFQSELVQTARLFKEAAASDMARYWRAPYGEQNPEIRRWAEEVGFHHIDWARDSKGSFDSLDWLTDESSKSYRSPEQIRKILLELEPEELNGAVVLMHLSTARGSDFPQKVIAPEIDALSARGYQILKVSELFPALSGRGAKK